MTLPATTEDLRRALEPAEKALWAHLHPHIPYDITMEEVCRGDVGPDGKFRLHPEDLARRAGRKAAA